MEVHDKLLKIRVALNNIDQYFDVEHPAYKALPLIIVVLCVFYFINRLINSFWPWLKRVWKICFYKILGNTLCRYDYHDYVASRPFLCDVNQASALCSRCKKSGFVFRD
jgi:hypothetical protein